MSLNGSSGGGALPVPCAAAGTGSPTVALAQAQALLHERLGLRLDGPNEVRLRAALDRRMAATGHAGLAQYLAKAAADEAEFAALVSLITIKETCFFREADHLRLLTEVLVPRLLTGHRPGPLRILSVGCATGEEPYSIAMALAETGGLELLRRTRITGCDVDAAALAEARSGRYRGPALRLLDQARRARWFTPAADGHWQIAETLREAVDFRPLNLLDRTWPPDLGGYDLIFYRNLSIYFDPPTRHAVLVRLRDLLHPHGSLIVGVTETLANSLGVLALREDVGVWYFSREQPPPADGTRGRAGGAASQPTSGIDAPPPPVVAAAAPMAPVEPTESELAALHQQARALAAAERFEAALALLEPACAGPAPPLPLLTLQATLWAARGDSAQAQAAARRVVAADPWAVEALVLLGRLARAEGRLDEASDWLRRAVYARPVHWPAHLALAECRWALGDRQAAARGFRATLRLLADESRALAEAGALPLALPLADLRRLCLARLNPANWTQGSGYGH